MLTLFGAAHRRHPGVQARPVRSLAAALQALEHQPFSRLGAGCQAPDEEVAAEPDCQPALEDVVASPHLASGLSGHELVTVEASIATRAGEGAAPLSKEPYMDPHRDPG